MIIVEQLKKSYKAVQAVRDVSFEAKNGQITTLLGANGSGKTTTFHAIAGLLRPDDGRVVVDGIEVATNPNEAQARMGIFPDKFGLYKRLTTREHLAYFGELHGMAQNDIDHAIRDISKLLGMEDILERRTEGFSQGQRMKTALARALLHRPPNLVLDEPSRGLDVMSIRLLRRVLLDLKAEGCCVLLSSHVMAEVEVLSDHIIIIESGVVREAGTAKDLIAKSGQKNLEDAFVFFANQQDAGQERDVA